MTRKTLFTRLALPVLRFRRRRGLTGGETAAEDSMEALPLITLTRLPTQATGPQGEREYEQRESIDSSTFSVSNLP